MRKRAAANGAQHIAPGDGTGSPPKPEAVSSCRSRAPCASIRNVTADFDVVPPQADALMESLRATGYSLPDAIADLIDNSITAGASNIWLDFH